MNCPRCKKPLHEILSQGVLVDFCTSCKGTWLDKGEAGFFSASPNEVTAALAGPLLDPKRSTAICPRCGGSMSEGGLFDPTYRLDRCDACEGIWFDAKELSRLRDRSLVSLDPGSGQRSRPTGRFAGGDGGAPDEAAPVEEAALLASVPSIPNLFLRSVTVFGGLAFLVGLAFVVAAEQAGLAPSAAVALTLGFLFLQYLIGPFLLDLSLRWMNGMRWVGIQELPRHLRPFLEETATRHRIKIPRFGLIDDGAPNAFTYGHHPGNARVVLTRGTIDLLDERELRAVVAHELGHVVHWDAVVMTLAGAIPILCYGLYRALLRASRGRGKNRGQLVLPAIVAYLIYVVSEYLVLLLSRTREYHADRFAAEATNDANALSSALVKIAYGLVETRPAKAAGESAESTGGLLSGARAFGIFDPGAARHLAAASYAGGAFSRENLVAAMQWDLWNPWARWFELHSTHPLPARRMQALAALSLKQGQIPLVVFDRKQPESFWDEFAVDLFIKVLPLVLAGGMALAALALLSPAAVPGSALLGFGLGLLGSTLFTYHLDAEQNGYPAASVASLLKRVKVSPVRGIPARLRGKVIGRGQPGYLFSEDVVLQDKTGILFLDYRAPFAVLHWWFALTRVPGLIGREVEALGWYRRGPAPYFELRELRVGGEVRRSWIYPMKLFFAGACIVAGAVIAVGSFLGRGF